MLIELSRKSNQKTVTFDDEYLSRLRSNDSETAEHFQRHFRRVAGSMLYGRFDRQTEADLVDEVLSAAIEKIMQGEPRDPSALPGYVRGICINVIKKVIRNRSREERVDLNIDRISGKWKTPEEAILERDTAEKVRRVMSVLRPRHQQILLALFFHGLRRDEVCEIYGVTRAQLRLILFHARCKFQKEWGDK
jgi:RNA polymerase sigma factor (sigma-70 family)